jgi:hypothetical protein
VEDARWSHLDGAFLDPDASGSKPGRAGSLAEHGEHVARQSDHGVVHHDVGPHPGFDSRTGRFATRAAEVGVACERAGVGRAPSTPSVTPIRCAAASCASARGPVTTTRMSFKRAAWRARR